MHFLSTVFDDIWEQKGKFFLAFFVMCTLSYGVLFAIDFIPEAPEENGEEVVSADTPVEVATTTVVAEVEKEVSRYPSRIAIAKLGTDVQVLNPQSSAIADLDQALLEGVVRHPDSADFKDTGTVVLFGHSSYLPQVNNKNFQAFNGLQKLEKEDEIRVFSDNTEYVYAVTKVYKAKASDASVDLKKGEETLVLVTCNSFGSKDDRFVVEAELLEKKAL